jgi:hypothetical protein
MQENFPDTLAGIAREQGLGLDGIEIWFADEARLGQKNGITRRSARRGTRPAAPQDQHYASTDIFGAVCPQDGKGAALVPPLCNTTAMNLHLAEISGMVSPGKHAVLLLDQAGWHLSGDVAVPDNITLLLLPPQTKVGQGPNARSSTRWRTSDGACGSSCARTNCRTGCSAITTEAKTATGQIVDHCCHHWNRLTDQPWRIMSIALREWADGF